MIKLYKINTGSCGGCDIEIALAVAQATDLAWAATPYDADALLLTGPITAGSRNAVLALVGGAPLPPVLAIGRCALDGHPFGKGGVQQIPMLAVQVRLDGCPPDPAAIAHTIRDALGVPQPHPTEDR
ncbi:MAG: NADH:ubiquinone oxidoreductase [Chloroflexaceae bacterium]|nr:NADH:ubiquinone oxidoreductase [Chloroflexaceae bacterium]NJO07193.1 NADH:ubiquinone oxidoreductase [Chloroflexaceae bacterium]